MFIMWLNTWMKGTADMQYRLNHWMQARVATNCWLQGRVDTIGWMKLSSSYYNWMCLCNHSDLPNRVELSHPVGEGEVCYQMNNEAFQA